MPVSYNYTVTDTHNKEKVEVCFEPLTQDDAEMLKGDDWQGARFQDVWIELAELEVAHKLIRCDGQNKDILGVVQIGHAPRLNGSIGGLRQSLLEVAPVHRFSTSRRRYAGIGRVLVARLVVASKEQGAEGRLLIHPVQSSIPFYRKLGFQQTLNPSKFRMSVPDAEALLLTCTTIN